MIVRCPHCSTRHAVRHRPGHSQGNQRCSVCGAAFPFLAVLEVELVELTRDCESMEPPGAPLVPMHVCPDATERLLAPTRPTTRNRAVAAIRGIRRHNRTWVPHMGRLTLGIVLTATLTLQFLIQERAALEKYPKLAARSDALCRQLPCPNLHRHIPGTIRIGGLQLDTQRQGWLHVEMLIANTLERPQPWPVLELALADRFGRALAQARWGPVDYLKPDEAARMLQPGEVWRLRLVIDQPADTVESISVHPL